jgi:hypothetical protein
VDVATMKGSHAPDADTTLTSQVPDAGAVPRTETVVAGDLPVFLEKDMVLTHLATQQQQQQAQQGASRKVAAEAAGWCC